MRLGQPFDKFKINQKTWILIYFISFFPFHWYICLRPISFGKILSTEGKCTTTRINEMGGFVSKFRFFTIKMEFFFQGIYLIGHVWFALFFFDAVSFFCCFRRQMSVTRPRTGTNHIHIIECHHYLSTANAKRIGCRPRALYTPPPLPFLMQMLFTNGASQSRPITRPPNKIYLDRRRYLFPFFYF